MSTYLYLRCNSHEEPVAAPQESAQQISYLPDIRQDIANREVLAAAAALDVWPGDYFRDASVRFFVRHAKCEDIDILDEYGVTYSATIAPPTLRFPLEPDRLKWAQYIDPEVTTTYGTYANRRQEYSAVSIKLFELGMQAADMVLDVGAAQGDFGRYLMRELGWPGRYVPLDGAMHGLDLDRTDTLSSWWPKARSEWVTSIETVEHVHDPDVLIDALVQTAIRGVVLTTPNGDILDVPSLDSTHYVSITRAQLEAHGLTVEGVTFSPDRDQPDTYLAWLLKE